MKPSIQAILDRLKELRSDLRSVHGHERPLLTLLVTQQGNCNDLDLPEWDEVSRLPLPSIAPWWKGNPNWKVEAESRRRWGGLCRGNTVDGAIGVVHWDWTMFDQEHLSNWHWITLMRLSACVGQDSFDELWNYFPRDVWKPICRYEPIAWILFLCELAWADEKALNCWEFVRPIAAFVPEESEGYQSHRRRIGLDIVSDVFGLPENPGPRGTAWLDDEFPEGNYAWATSHWWMEFSDLIGASIEAVDWLIGWIEQGGERPVEIHQAREAGLSDNQRDVLICYEEAGAIDTESGREFTDVFLRKFQRKPNSKERATARQCFNLGLLCESSGQVNLRYISDKGLAALRAKQGQP